MFSIIHPGLFAAGFACIAIPIIIHLLRRKRKPISWGAMRFLEQAYRKRKRILTIEQLILLVMRCALVILLAAGIGGLMLGAPSQSNAPVALTIVLDNAIGSALLTDAGGSALDQSKRAALEALDGLNPSRGDRAALITLAAPSIALVMHPTTDLDAIRALIRSTQPTDSAPDFQSMLELLNAQDPSEENTVESLLIASHFRGITASTIAQDAASARFTKITVSSPPTSTPTNIGIKSMTPSRALRLTETATTLPITIHMALTRTGDLPDASTTITITDAGSGEQLARHLHRWNTADTDAAIIVALNTDKLTSLRAGSAPLIATIDDDANPRDNTSACIVRLRPNLRVGVIESDANTSSTIRPSRSLRAALSPGDTSPIDLLMLDPTRISTARLATLDAVFILTPNALPTDAWSTLASANRSGLVILITPDADSPSAQWTKHLDAFAIPDAPQSILPTTHARPRLLAETLPATTVLAALQSEYAPLARSVHTTRSIDLSTFTAANPIARFADGSPFAVHFTSPSPAGSIILLSTAIDLAWTDLPARPLFVPFMQELTRQSVGRSATRTKIIAGNPPADAESFAPMRTAHTAFGVNASASSTLSHAGLYTPLDDDGAATSIVAVNPDATAAHTTPTTQQALADQLTRVFGTDTINWLTPATEQATPQAPLQASVTTRFGFAGIIFLIAGILALLELILARVFSFRAEATQAGSSA